MNRQQPLIHNLYTYLPTSVLVLDIAAYRKASFLILPHQTLYPCAASIILAKIPLDCIPTSYVAMTHTLIAGMYGENALIDGSVLAFTEPIRTNNPFKQRGSIANFITDNGTERLIFKRRTTIADYLSNDSATVTQFTKPPWSSNGYQEKRVMQKGIVLVQGDMREQEMLAKAIDTFCSMAHAGDFFLANLIYTVKKLHWSNDFGLYGHKELASTETQQLPPKPVTAGKTEPKEIDLYHPPTDWTDDESDYFRFF